MTETPTKPDNTIQPATQAKRVFKITLEHDPDTDNPIGESGDHKERFVSFNRRHKAYSDPSEWFEGVNRHGEVIFTPQGFGLRRQVETETAFILSYFEHGSCVWSLQGTGPQCRFDSADVAGIYWLPSDVPKDRRREYAKQTLETYTDWCNGQCFYYSVEDNETGEHLDSCGGYVGSKHLADCLLESLNALADGMPFEVVWEGECKDVAMYGKLARLTEYDEDQDEDQDDD